MVGGLKRHELKGRPGAGMHAVGIEPPSSSSGLLFPFFGYAGGCDVIASLPVHHLPSVILPLSSVVLKGSPPVPIPIGAPLIPGFRWAVRCHGSDEAGRVAPPVYYVRREGRLPRVSNTAGDSHIDEILPKKQAEEC